MTNIAYVPKLQLGDNVAIIWEQGQYGKVVHYKLVGNKWNNFSLANILTGELLTPPLGTLSDLQEVLQNELDNGRFKFISVF